MTEDRSPRPDGAARRRRPPLDAAKIVGAALRIADEEGLEAVSIRRIAAALDARPMSIYDHFESKDELLGAMLDEAVADVLAPEPLPGEWREALAMIARRTYATMLAHPWIVAVSSRGPRYGPNSTATARQAARAAAGLELEPAEMWAVVGTINDYVLGHALRTTAVPRGDLADMIAADELAATPELASLPESLRTRGSVERFEAGLEIVLDGVEKRILG